MRSQLTLVLRPMYGNPCRAPARIMEKILLDQVRRQQWARQLAGMVDRIKRVRLRAEEHFQTFIIQLSDSRQAAVTDGREMSEQGLDQHHISGQDIVQLNLNKHGCSTIREAKCQTRGVWNFDSGFSIVIIV